jgi:hypothetical protein
MKIRYKNRRLNFNLFFGIIWLVYSLYGLFTKENPKWSDFGFLIISLLYIATYFYEKKNQYLTIENGMIYNNWPFSKKINLAEIVAVKKFARDYTLITENDKLKINTQIIDKDFLMEFKLVFYNLKTEPKKNPL